MQVRAHRAEGEAIGVEWMIHKAQELNESRYVIFSQYILINRYYIDGAVFSRHWIKNVLNRNDLTLRAPSNTQKESVESSIPKVFNNLLLFFYLLL